MLQYALCSHLTSAAKALEANRILPPGYSNGHCKVSSSFQRDATSHVTVDCSNCLDRQRQVWEDL